MQTHNQLQNLFFTIKAVRYHAEGQLFSQSTRAILVAEDQAAAWISKCIKQSS